MEADMQYKAEVVAGEQLQDLQAKLDEINAKQAGLISVIWQDYSHTYVVVYEYDSSSKTKEGK